MATECGLQFTKLSITCRALISLFLSALAWDGAFAARQTVDGLTIDYGAPFKESPEAAARQLQSSGSEAEKVVQSMRVFVAGPADGINQLYVTTIHFSDGFDRSFSLDGAAKLAATRITSLAGISGETHTIVQTRIAGREARRTTLEAERYNGTVGLESVVFYDRARNVAYQVNCIYTKAGANSVALGNRLQAERAAASRIIDSIRS